MGDEASSTETRHDSEPTLTCMCAILVVSERRSAFCVLRAMLDPADFGFGDEVCDGKVLRLSFYSRKLCMLLGRGEGE